MKKKICIFFLTLICLVCPNIFEIQEACAKKIYAQEINNEQANEQETNQYDSQSYTKEFIEQLLRDINGENIDSYTGDAISEKMTFTSLVSTLALSSKSDIPVVIGKYVFDSFFYEIKMVRQIMIQLIGFAAVFAILNRGLITSNGYVYNMSFLMIYCAMMILLVESFGLISELVKQALEQMISFVSALIPAYTTALFFSGNATSAASFYSFSLAMVYIIQWMFRVIILPMINMFMLVQMLDHIFDEKKLTKFTDLLEEIIIMILKTSIGIVGGAQVIQAFIGPAKDRVTDSLLLKSVNAIPGVGNVTGLTNEVIFSCGMLVKNCIGAAGLIILISIMIIPIIKVLVFFLGYRVLAACLQPISDIRIVEAIHDISRGMGLYLRLLIQSSLLFFITISLTCASTSFVH